MDDDWDLHAVVRSCCSAAASSASASQLSSTSEPRCDFSAPWIRNPLDPAKECGPEELKDLCLPFFTDWRDAQQKITFSQVDCPISPEQLPQPQLRRKPPPFPGGAKPGSSKGPVRRGKKRKSMTKKQVCCVDAEKLSSDGWCWRKYGQKPIKGSPFPRGYYRCSSSKSCIARKQVERDKSDPEMFLVTYTAEHNHPAPTHRNSLSGTARQKPTPDSEKTEVRGKQKDENKRDGDGEAERDEFSISNMALDDDFFVGLEDFTRVDDEGFFPVNTTAEKS